MRQEFSMGQIWKPTSISKECKINKELFEIYKNHIVSDDEVLEDFKEIAWDDISVEAIDENGIHHGVPALEFSNVFTWLFVTNLRVIFNTWYNLKTLWKISSYSKFDLIILLYHRNSPNQVIETQSVSPTVAEQVCNKKRIVQKIPEDPRFVWDIILHTKFDLWTSPTLFEKPC